MMDKATLTALRKSIKHWKEILKIVKENRGSDVTEVNDCHFRVGKDYSFKIGSSGCALCLFFHSNCKCCVIGSSRRSCSYTPWKEVVWELEGSRIVTTGVIKAVEKEVEFLISLLPKPKKKSTSIKKKSTSKKAVVVR